MIIETNLCDVTDKGANIGVTIHKAKSKKLNELPETLNNLFDGVYMSMEIVSILRALKEYNEGAFNHAMDIFVTEELAEAEEDEDSE